MGTTITVGKLAAAFQAQGGQVVYALYEKTYESNVFPRTPRWSCTFLGPSDLAIKRIFEYASSCEGGMLTSRARNLTPEGYITKWLQELAKPAQLHDRSVRLEVGTGYLYAIQKDKVAEVKELLRQHGLEELGPGLDNQGRIDVRLHRDIAFLQALISTLRVPSWRILDGFPPEQGPWAPELGYRPSKALGYEVRVPAFLKVDQENYLLQRPDGTWYCGGWGYSIVGEFVRGLWSSELKEPGSSAEQIKAFRQAMRDAPQMPAGTLVFVDQTVSMADRPWIQQEIAKLASSPAARPGVGGFYVDPAEDKQLLWELTRLPRECATWVLPQDHVMPVTSPQAALAL